ncbi:hypothetical protein CLFO_30290 [Clostridium formicaceticum]|nr:hypothetical protein CLFO_30290 [Clostridium formicaceticum]
MRQVAGSYVVVPTGKAALDFSGMITFNETGGFLWSQLEKGKTQQQMLTALLEEYDVNEATAKADITEFLAKLKAADLFE